MGVVSDPAFSNGNLPRQIRDIRQQLKQVAASRRLENASIGAGGITIRDGGSLTILDGGGSKTLHRNGATAFQWGTISDAAGVREGNGMAVRATTGEPILQAIETSSGDLQLFGGDEGRPLKFVGLTAKDSVTLFADNTNALSGFIDLNSSFGDIFLNTGSGKVWLWQPPTTGSAANAHIDPTTYLLSRSTSSLKYKTDVEDHAIDPAAVMRLRPRAWRDKAEVADDPAGAGWYVGLVAEEVAEALPEMVTYDADGNPDAVAYDRLAVALLEVVRHLAERVSALDGKTVPSRTPPPGRAQRWKMTAKSRRARPDHAPAPGKPAPGATGRTSRRGGR